MCIHVCHFKQDGRRAKEHQLDCFFRLPLAYFPPSRNRSVQGKLDRVGFAHHLRANSLANCHRCRVLKAGGAVGIITSFIAFYMGLSELLASERSRFFTLPQGPFGPAII